jgi:hypothetical protein
MEIVTPASSNSPRIEFVQENDHYYFMRKTKLQCKHCTRSVEPCEFDACDLAQSNDHILVCKYCKHDNYQQTLFEENASWLTKSMYYPYQHERTIMDKCWRCGQKDVDAMYRFIFDTKGMNIVSLEIACMTCKKFFIVFDS